MTYIRYDKTKVAGHKLEIQEILGTFNVLNSPLHENPRVGKRAACSASFDPYHTITSGTPFAPFTGLVWGADRSPILLSQHPLSGMWPLDQTCIHPRELPSLIEEIFSNRDERDATRRLLGEDAQFFIDVIDEARSMLARGCESAD